MYEIITSDIDILYYGCGYLDDDLPVSKIKKKTVFLFNF